MLVADVILQPTAPHPRQHDSQRHETRADRVMRRLMFAAQPRRQQAKVAPAKALRGSKASATKSSHAPGKQPKASAPSVGKVNQRGNASGLQRFLQNQWRDKVLTEAIGEILKRAAVPLSTDEVMAALYDGLPKADYDRAKHSLANILSVGKSKGTWQSTGRGRYASNGVTA